MSLTKEFLNAIENALNKALERSAPGATEACMKNQKFIEELTHQTTTFQKSVDDIKDVPLPVAQFSLLSTINQHVSSARVNCGVFGNQADRINETLSQDANNAIKDVATAFAIRQKPMLA